MLWRNPVSPILIQDLRVMDRDVVVVTREVAAHDGSVGIVRRQLDLLGIGRRKQPRWRWLRPLRTLHLSLDPGPPVGRPQSSDRAGPWGRLSCVEQPQLMVSAAS